MATAKHPTLSVRAFAELLRLPAYEQLRVLHDQKYPKSGPQSFRIPFYQPALKGIRDYYRSNNAAASLSAARAAANNARLEARRVHNLRVIDQFEKSAQAKRKLRPQAIHDFNRTVSGVEIRLRFDLVAQESSVIRYILYNLRNAAIDAETARTTLEIATWVLESAGLKVPVKHLEYVDISSGHSTTGSKVRIATLKNVQANAKLIRTLWPTV